jgi:hypothetical protein
VTKRKTTPHLKRGPKPKAPKPPKPKGKPGRPERVPLRQHPLRYNIAHAVAASGMTGSSMRGGATLFSWYELGRQPKKDPDEKYVDRLRKLIEAYTHSTPEDLLWLDTMADAVFIAVMFANIDAEAAIEEVTRRASSIGEMEYAEKVLLPSLIDIRSKRTPCRK